MGAQTSAQRDERSQEDASAEELSAAAHESQEGDSLAEPKLLQKNGQISSIPSLNGHSEDNTLAEEVSGQTDVSVSQKEEVPEMMDALPGEAAPQVNGEKEEKDSPDANDITAAEEKPAEEKPAEANEVGFKKIFRFVGFKFTLKKNEKKDPVQLLTVKNNEGEEEEAGGSEEAKEDAATPAAEEEVKAEDQVVETEVAVAEAPAAEAPATNADADAPALEAVAETTEGEAATAVGEVAKEEEGATEKEPEEQATSPTSPPQEVSAFKKFFTQGIFSNLRKKTSFKKSKEEEPKEAPVEEEIKEGEESAEAEVVVAEEGAKPEASEGEEKEEELPTTEDGKPEASPVTETAAIEEVSVEVEAEVKAEVAPETSAPAATDATEEVKSTEEKAEEAAEGDKAPTEVIAEAELLSSQEKAKAQGSPLKKLFAGAGLKKLSSKKQKAKKDTEAKLVESGEQAAEQLQSSTELVEGQKPSSGPSSPEDSGEHIIGAEASSQAEAGQDSEAEAATSDGEKKKDGILPWSSFKKLVTPKKRVKRPSESEDEATGEKPKSATLSSTESTGFVDKPASEEETKPTAEEEQKTENTEKLEGSTEEPKKKMDTSVSWEALMCMGGKNKRTRRTSDSDDDETKIEEETQPAGEEDAKTVESPLLSSQEAEHEMSVSSPETGNTSAAEGELVSTWESLKRFVSQKSKKSKGDEKAEEGGHTEVLSDSEIPKEESSFSLRKLIPGRKKKKSDKQLSSDVGSGEDDSDTPAVVPLSEYDNEQQAAPEETVETPAAPQVSTEDRAPSWISTMLVTEEAHEQLSDIPEEGDTAATPKSADTTIADEIVDLTAEAVVAQEERSVMSAAPATTIAEEIVELTTEVAVAQEEVVTVSSADVTTSVEEAIDLTTEVVSQEEVPATSAVEVPTTPEEIVDQTTEVVVAQEEVPATSAAEMTTDLLLMTQDTTPVPEFEQETMDVVLEAAVEVSEVTTELSTTVEELPQEEANTGMEPPAPIEFATPETNFVLGAHVKEAAATICTGLDTEDIDQVMIEKPVMTTEVCVDTVTNAQVAEVSIVRDAHDKEAAMAISTGLGTTEIDTVEIENPATTTMEDVAVVSNVMTAEVPIEEKSEKIEEALTAEDEVFKAQVEQVETTELEPPTEKILNEETPKPENASDGKEPEIIQEATVSSIQSEAEIVQPPVMSENTPKVEMIDPIEPTTEAAICNEIIQTTAPAVVETKCEEMQDVEETAVVELKAPVCEVTQAASHEMASVMPETPLADETFEATVSVVAPTEECAIAKDTVCLTAPLPIDLEEAQVKQEENPLENVPVSEPALDQIQVQVMEVPIEVASTTGEAEIEAPESDVSGIIMEATEKVQEEPEAEVANFIEEQGMAIAQVVIQNAVGLVQSKPEPAEPAPVGDEVQAATTIEEEIPAEKHIICETPVLQLCETPAPETLAPETSAAEALVPETAPKASVEAEIPKQLHEAIEVTEMISVEILEQEAPKQPEEPVKTLAPEIPAPENLASETSGPETPVPETPVPETPATETPVPETPATETPLPETPISETPATETPAMETPATETPATEIPATETLAPDTPAPEASVEADKPPKQLHEAIEVTEMVSVEVLEPEAPKQPEEPVKQEVEEEKEEVDLKQYAEVVICQESVETVEAEVKEIPESQMNGKSDEIQEEESKVEVPQVASPAVVKEVEVQQAEVKEVPMAAAVKAETPVLEALAQPEEKTEVAAPVVHQATQVIEEHAVEVIGEQVLEEIVMEAVVEFNGTGVASDNAAAANASVLAIAVETNMNEVKESTTEEAEKTVSTDAAAPNQEVSSPAEPAAVAETEKTSAVKCAEVMAQVIEVIEEAVKEIEPISTELTAAS